MDKKKIITNISIYAIALAIFNIISFVIPFRHVGIFWAAYAFGMVAIFSQIGVEVLALMGKTTLKEKIYALPVLKMGLTYLLVQLAVTLVFYIITLFTTACPVWIAWVVCPIILGVFAALVLLTDTTRDVIEKVEKETERQTAQVKTFRINIDSILRRVEDKELLKKLEKLSDIAKYSDPVSNETLYDIEAEITDKIARIDTCVRNDEVEDAKVLTEQTIDLFEDRNALCKNSKR